MTVNPGWGGQEFIPASPDKIARLRALVGDAVEVRSTAASTSRPPVVRDGGRLALRRGHVVFGAQDPGEAYRAIARLVEGG
jgi:ribulose-phosphate 3-epimerase